MNRRQQAERIASASHFVGEFPLLSDEGDQFESSDKCDSCHVASFGHRFNVLVCRNPGDEPEKCIICDECRYFHEYGTFGDDRQHEFDNPKLLEFGEYSDCIEYVNQEDDYDSMCGKWFYDDADNLVIYWGTFGNYNSPGADSCTYAEVCEDREEFDKLLAKWESLPEYIETDDDTDDDDCDDDTDDDEDSEDCDDE